MGSKILRVVMAHQRLAADERCVQFVSRAVESAHNVRIYGEMVAVLWDEGNVAAAIALEDLWNDLATRYPFSLFCAYPMRAFDTDASIEGYRTICGQHSTVLLQDQGT